MKQHKLHQYTTKYYKTTELDFYIKYWLLNGKISELQHPRGVQTPKQIIILYRVN